MKSTEVPASLRIWFVVHFWADMVVAVPLMIAPDAVLTLMGWGTVDPVASRLVAAALLGIGVESLLGRNASAETFRAMLNLKIIWSGAAIIALGIGVAQGAGAITTAFLATFAVFCAIWIYYRRRLGPSGDHSA
ncbi:MAG: hypothetical protein EXR28_16020 [Betaproteobacteria bacterium]|nr:hypothetical protein [Betaproteobacteria bacterium]